MSSNQFILTKEHLTGWLSDPSYMEEYKSQVYRSILQFYFDTFFEEISPAKRAIVEIEKDLGIPIEKEVLLNLFYYDYWSRKKKREKAKEKVALPNPAPVADHTAVSISHPIIDKTVQETKTKVFDFKDAKEIAGAKKPLYVGKKQREQEQAQKDQQQQKN